MQIVMNMLTDDKKITLRLTRFKVFTGGAALIYNIDLFILVCCYYLFALD